MSNQLFFMLTQTFEEYNKTSLDDILVYASQTNAGFIPWMLSALFIVVVIGTYFGSRKFNGQGDIFASLSVASFFTFMVAFIMQLTSGIVNNITLSVVFVVMVLSIIILFFSRER